jgi:hypothetical protein
MFSKVKRQKRSAEEEQYFMENYYSQKWKTLCILCSESVIYRTSSIKLNIKYCDMSPRSQNTGVGEA